VRNAQALRPAGFQVSTVSVATMPTALSADSLKGGTRVRSDLDVLSEPMIACVGVSELTAATHLRRKAAKD